MESGQPEPLLPALREAELTLERALTEACASKPATKADTGELIKIEEVLQIANDAAKRAISLRRRRRVDRSQHSERRVMVDVEAAASDRGTHRTFVDVAGVSWDVFAVHPESRLARQSQLSGSFKEGWLCFDSGSEKRRLSPIPDNWQTIAEADLIRLAQRAEAAPKRRRRSRGDGDAPNPPPSA